MTSFRRRVVAEWLTCDPQEYIARELERPLASPTKVRSADQKQTVYRDD